MARYTHENTPGLTDDALASLNERYEAASKRVDAATQVDPGFWDRLATVILDDFTTQRKVAEAMTTYQAKGNREDLA
jgi:hypothetical protein